MNLTIGLLIPFLGTSLGSAMVFFDEKQISSKRHKKIDLLQSINLVSSWCDDFTFWSGCRRYLQLFSH